MILQIRVKANAKTNAVGEVVNDRLIVSVQAPAVDGKANEAIKKVLAKHFKVKQRDIEIISGEKSRDKKINVAGAGIEPAT